MRYLTIVISLLLLITSCNSNNATRSKGEVAQESQPCSLRIEIASQSSHIELYTFVQGEQKSLTIDRVLDLSGSEKEIIDLSSTIGSKLEIQMKTDDSYGPEVNIKVFVNDELFLEASDPYKINIAETIAVPQHSKGV